MRIPPRLCCCSRRVSMRLLCPDAGEVGANCWSGLFEELQVTTSRLRQRARIWRAGAMVESAVGREWMSSWKPWCTNPPARCISRTGSRLSSSRNEGISEPKLCASHSRL